MANNGAAQIIFEVENGKSYALAAIIFGSALAMLLVKLWGGETFGRVYETTRDEAFQLATLVLIAYVAIQLLGDLSLSIQMGQLDDVDENNALQTRKIISGCIGALLGLLFIIGLCSYFNCKTRVLGAARGAYSRIFRFGKKRR